jgi:hypothetical protein
MSQKFLNSIKECRRYGVFGVRVQFSTMSELKQIRILNLKALIATSLPLKPKKKFYSSNWCSHQVFNHTNQTKNGENMRLELERGLELFFSKFWKQNAIYGYVLIFCMADLIVLHSNSVHLVHPIHPSPIYIYIYEDMRLTSKIEERPYKA